MSDLSAASEAMDIPESLVQRSAAARAAASGSSVDEVLTAWAGGESAPATPPPAEPEPEPETQPEPEPETTEPEPASAPAEQAQPAAAAAPVATQAVPREALPPVTPPVLTGRTEHPFAMMAGAVALLAVALLVGFVAPAIPTEPDAVYSSAARYSQAGLDGREIYRSEGCGACHTQLVRPIVADAGLGPVTLNDSNKVLGTRRYGPDLAHVGSRVESPSALLSVLTATSDHPSYAGLSDADLEDLVTYLFESK